MEMEEFALGDTWVHGLDRSLKIVTTIIFSIIVALSNSIHLACVSLIVPVALMIWARLDFRKLIIRLAKVNGFIVFLWLFLPFTTPWKTIYYIGPLTIRREGCYRALLTVTKSNSIFSMAMASLRTSQISKLVHALSHQFVSDKLVHLFFFCFGYIHVVHEEYRRLVNAMKMRGFKPKTSTNTCRVYSHHVGMLLIRSFGRFKRILGAMMFRGFKVKINVLHHYEMKRYDHVPTGSSMAFSILLMVAR